MLVLNHYYHDEYADCCGDDYYYCYYCYFPMWMDDKPLCHAVDENRFCWRCAGVIRLGQVLVECPREACRIPLHLNCVLPHWQKAHRHVPLPDAYGYAATATTTLVTIELILLPRLLHLLLLRHCHHVSCGCYRL